MRGDQERRPPRQRGGRPVGGRRASLTWRERQVAALVARGLSNRQIGEELGIGERTVETHTRNLLRKLELPSRAQLVVWAVERRLGAQHPQQPW